MLPPLGGTGRGGVNPCGGENDLSMLSFQSRKTKSHGEATFKHCSRKASTDPLTCRLTAIRGTAQTVSLSPQRAPLSRASKLAPPPLSPKTNRSMRTNSPLRSVRRRGTPWSSTASLSKEIND